MRTLRSILFNLVFYGLTVPMVLAAFPVSLASTAGLRAYVRSWLRFHRWCAGVFLGIRSRIEGEVPAGAVLVAAKHQSMFETMELALMLREPAIFVKRELADIPLWGWLGQRYGLIPVDRAGGAKALRAMMQAGEQARQDGRALLIFPEGTRVKPGETPPLQPGFAGLYRALGLPVVAVALDSGKVWPRGSLRQRAGVVTNRFAPALPPGLARAEIEQKVHAEINALEPAVAEA